MATTFDEPGTTREILVRTNLHLAGAVQPSRTDPPRRSQERRRLRPESNVTNGRKRYLQADAGTEDTSFPIKPSIVPAGAPSPKIVAETASSSGET